MASLTKRALLEDSVLFHACVSQSKLSHYWHRWVKSQQTCNFIFALISAVMEHRWMREFQKNMAHWSNPQPVYDHINPSISSQGVPILYSGEWLKSTPRLTFDALLSLSLPDPKVSVWFGFRGGRHNKVKRKPHVSNLNITFVFTSKVNYDVVLVYSRSQA